MKHSPPPLKQPLSPTACQRLASCQHKAQLWGHLTEPVPVSQKENPCPWARTKRARIFLSSAREGRLALLCLNPSSGKSYPEIPARQTSPRQRYCPLTHEYPGICFGTIWRVKKGSCSLLAVMFGADSDWEKGQACCWPAIFTEWIS